MSDCHRVAYIGFSNQVKALLNIAERDMGLDNLRPGKEKLFEKWTGFAFQRNGISRLGFAKVNSELLKLMATGIAQVWLEWETTRNNKKIPAVKIIMSSQGRPQTKVSPLSIKSNIQTIFITSIILSALALVLLIAEICLKFFNMLLQLWVLLQSFSPN